MIVSYKDLEVWKKSIEFVKVIYRVTKDFPHEEQYGLVSQMRRAAVSIPSNIAEGKVKQSRSEYVRFLYMAFGSAAELETQLIISAELGYLKRERGTELCDLLAEISKMLNRLIFSLKPRT